MVRELGINAKSLSDLLGIHKWYLILRYQERAIYHLYEISRKEKPKVTQ